MTNNQRNDHIQTVCFDKDNENLVQDQIKTSALAVSGSQAIML
jgi:hypothetical protein